jgi:hypothetical protein
MGYQAGIHERETDAACTNDCVFATHDEADRAGRELLSRWTLPHHHSVVETDRAVNYEFPEGAGRPTRCCSTQD